MEMVGIDQEIRAVCFIEEVHHTQKDTCDLKTNYGERNNRLKLEKTE